MKAQDFLRKGADLLEERGKQYDQPGGERSMGKAVSAFNTITGRSLSEAEGWLLLQVLKDVRQWQNPDKYHADSAEDCVSYAALKAESLQAEQFLRDGLTDETIKAASFAHGGPISSDSVYLVGEQFDDFGAPLPVEPASAIDDDSARMQAIGQNGNTGEHYDGAPIWDDAPEWAMWLAQQEHGAWEFYEDKPTCERGTYWRHELRGVRARADDKTRANPNWRNTLQARPTKEAI